MNRNAKKNTFGKNKKKAQNIRSMHLEQVKLIFISLFNVNFYEFYVLWDACLCLSETKKIIDDTFEWKRFF